METRSCLPLVLAAVLVMGAHVEGLQISFNPTVITDGTTSSFTVRCDLAGTSTGDTIYDLTMFKESTKIVDFTGGSPVVAPAFQQRATATGSLSTGSAYVAVTFNAGVSCSDSGYYKCAATFKPPPGSTTVSAETNRTLQANSNPETLAMIARPTKPQYAVNESVELVCTGLIGKPAISSWQWQTRASGFQSTWTRIRTDIQQTDETATTSGQCQMSGRSSLNFRLQAMDDNTMYRCSYKNEAYSANFTFQLSSTATPSPGGSTDTGASSANVGMIIGIVLGVLALIAVVVILVFLFVVRKKRNRGEDYDTGEGKEGPGADSETDLHANPVYTLPSKTPKYSMDTETGDEEEDEPPVPLDPEKQRELEQQERIKAKQKNLISGLQSNQLFQRRSKRTKDGEKRADPRQGLENQAVDGDLADRDQDPHGRSHGRGRHRRGPDAYENGEGRRYRESQDPRDARDYRPPQGSDDAPYPEAKRDHRYDDDGTDNRAYVPQEAIGSAV